MTFGQQDDFAIEAYHEPYGPNYGGYGRMCIHIQGIQLGNLRENHCSLFGATARFREVLNIIESLWEEGFEGRPDHEIFDILDRAMYEDHGESLEEMEAARKRLGKYNFLTNEGEMFDSTKTFIICRPGGLVHVLYEQRDDTCGSVSCHVKSFRSATETFLQWFDEQVRNTSPPYFPINPFDLNEKVPDDWP